MTFGPITVVERLGVTGPKDTNVLYACRCACGGRREIRGCHLKAMAKLDACRCRGNGRPRHQYRAKTIVPMESKFPGFVVWRMGIYVASAKKKQRQWELTAERFRGLIQQACWYCGVEPGLQTWMRRSSGGRSPTVYQFRAHGIDRIDNSLGYTVENSVPCCETCNFTKRDMLVDEWLAWSERLVTYQRAKKELENQITHDVLADRLM